MTWSGGATRARSTSCRPSARPSSRAAMSPHRDPDRASGPYEHRVVAWDEVGEDEGTGIVHIAPGCGAEDFQLGKALGLPVIAPLDEAGVLLSTASTGSRAGARSTWRTRSSRTSTPQGPVLPPRDHLTPLSALLALRHAAALPPRGRVVHQHGPGLRPAARHADPRAGRRQPPLPDHGDRGPDPLDPGIRVRPGAGLAPEHARLDDQQEALLRPRAADLRLPGVRHVHGRRRPRGPARARRSRAGSSSRAIRRTARSSTR